MRSVVLFAPHLDRDLCALHEAVPQLVTFVGLPTLRGEDGCLENHKTVIREAAALGEPCVFVMEDDCAFTEHFSFDRWCADATWAQTNGYDVMAGGCTRTYRERVVRWGASPMIEVSAFHSAHCVVYFASGYEKALHAVQPYDMSLGRDCGMRCVLTWPFVAVQKPSFSGILKQQVDYRLLYREHETTLGRALGLPS